MDFNQELNDIKTQINQSLNKINNTSTNKLLLHIQNNTGKLLRPLLLILCIEWLKKAPLTKQEYQNMINIAVTIELLHTASLIHDDIIDNSELRRSKETINKKFGNENAVTMGTYLYARSLNEISKINNIEIIKKLANTVESMCNGELKQLNSRKAPTLNVLNYFKIIKHKTGDLFALTCESTSHILNLDEKTQIKLRKLGQYIGIIYQLSDDLIDFNNTQNIGKKNNEDINNGLITLPVILLLQKKTKNEQIKYLKLIQSKALAPIVLNELKKETKNNEIENKIIQIISKYNHKIKKLMKKISEKNNNVEELLTIINNRIKNNIKEVKNENS